MKHVGIEIKFYNLDTFNKQIDVNFIDLDSELVDLNYKVASSIFCHFWRSIPYLGRFRNSQQAFAKGVLIPRPFSLRSRRLEVVGKRNNGRARRRHACLPRVRPFSLSPTSSKRLLRRLAAICLPCG